MRSGEPAKVTSTPRRWSSSATFFFLMTRPPPTSTRETTLFPYTTLFRSVRQIPLTVDHPNSHRDTRLVRKLANRSEEHTSELQSQSHISYAVFCLKKK